MKILVVDDDDNSRTMLAALLEGSGYSVEKASDGEEAWKMLEESTPELIITDILMPRMDGFSLCRKVKGDPRFKQTPSFFIPQLMFPKRTRNLLWLWGEPCLLSSLKIRKSW